MSNLYLKNCKYCGYPAWVDTEFINGQQVYCISCSAPSSACGKMSFTKWYPTQAEAVNAWNKNNTFEASRRKDFN